MKSLCFALVAVMLLVYGCASGPMKYKPEVYKTQADYSQAVTECKDVVKPREGGFFMFGPAILVLPISAVIAAVDANDRDNFQKCMEERGYTCIDNCAYAPKKETAKIDTE